MTDCACVRIYSTLLSALLLLGLRGMVLWRVMGSMTQLASIESKSFCLAGCRTSMNSLRESSLCYRLGS
jgi:CII-binding regulator of phage lambda lysogenization HflD